MLALSMCRKVVTECHQPLSIGCSRSQHLVGLAVPWCPSWWLAFISPQSTGAGYLMDRHLESPKVSQCPIVVVALLDHQLVGTGSPTSWHLEGLAVPQCPLGKVICWTHQPVDCSTGWHCTCLAAMQGFVCSWTWESLMCLHELQVLRCSLV